MWCKVVLIIITASLLVFSQALDWQKGRNGKKGNGEFIEIDNATYFIDASTGYHRDEAKAMCESINMTMINFEGDVQKWLSITRWLNDNAIGFYYFWTDALRDEGSVKWYWETSKNIISENDFHWGTGQPSMLNAAVRSCINFSYEFGGYDDDDCLDYPTLNALCQ